MIRHQSVEEGKDKETAKIKHTGNVIGPNGESISLGHVLTGISAGQHRNRNFAYYPIFGDSMDNLFTVTIGDLGQSAAFVNTNQHVGIAPNTYIGPNTEATYSELRGDIHGWVIGDNISGILGNRSLYSNGSSQSTKGLPPISVSDILEECYISKTNPYNYDNFNDIFYRYAITSLGDETGAFAETYSYKSNVRGMFLGPFSLTNQEVKEAVVEFNQWFDQERKK
jgi:hypothetical protein